ncbi:sensor histidine kinase [Nonomuraea sp. NPDC050556]|uniref:sensor histidine kinase n=1 Tax=Nonomuraea sp. NPDC050556 TaxID=3364369 RepID=UPI003798354D
MAAMDTSLNNAWAYVRGLPQADLVIAAALAFVGLVQPGYGAPLPAHLLGVLLATLPLALRHRQPYIAVFLPLTGPFLLVSTGESVFTMPVAVYLAGMLCFYTLLRQLSRQQAWLLGILAALGWLAVAAFDTLRGGLTLDLGDLLGTLYGSAFYLGAAVASVVITLVSDLRRTRTEVTQAKAVNVETLREQAAMAERARIAREMHDVVAHSISMIAVRAESAPYTLDNLGDAAKEEFAEIAADARTTLSEMRRLLGVLRADVKTTPETAPQPGLARLGELIQQHDGEVDLDVVGEQASLPQAVDVSAYRIIQECLANARKHAPGSRVSIEIAYRPGLLAIRVANDGPPATVAEGGHGLIGMRERALSMGGWFNAEPIAGGGFLVKAGLPLE